MKQIRWITLLLLVLTFCAVRTEAAEYVKGGTCGTDLTWVLLDDGTLTISGTGEMTDYANGDPAPWSSYGEIRHVIVQEGVASIGEHAFRYCTALSDIELPDTLTNIGKAAFSHSGLKSIVIPDSVTDIEDFAFSDCYSLEYIELSDGLEFIGWDVFLYCMSLEHIEIPASVTFIGGFAFEDCRNLAAVTFLGDAPEFHAEAFCRLTATVYYPADNATWTEDVRRFCGDSGITWIPYSGDREVASGWSGATEWILTTDGVMRVYGQGNMKNYDYDGEKPWTPYTEQIIKVVIEEGVTGIGECAFKNLYNLRSVTLPESGLKRIGEAAFYGCHSLDTLYIPDGIYTIWAYTFKLCTGLRSIRLPGTLEKIDQGAFETCVSLEELFVPTHVSIIGAWSFKGCSSLQEADLQWADATEIREGAFKNCTALTRVHFPKQIQILGDSAFYGIGAERFTVPGTVTELGPWCFARANVKELTFEGDAPAIGEGAFNAVTLTAFYPGGNATWDSGKMLNYGGSVTWIAN